MTGGQVRRRRRMVPSYLATGGSGTPTRNTLQPLTALIASGLPPAPHHTATHQRVLTLLQGGALTVTETAGYLRIPIGVCKVLAAELVDDGQLRAQVAIPDALAPDPDAAAPDKRLLERVASGLRKLKD